MVWVPLVVYWIFTASWMFKKLEIFSPEAVCFLIAANLWSDYIHFSMHFNVLTNHNFRSCRLSLGVSNGWCLIRIISRQPLLIGFPILFYFLFIYLFIFVKATYCLGNKWVHDKPIEIFKATCFNWNIKRPFCYPKGFKEY